MDDTCKTILDFLRNQPEYECPYYDEQFENACTSMNLDYDIADAAVSYLVDEGYIDYLRSQNGSLMGISLSYKGINYENFINQNNQSNISPQIFNINQVYNSAFGNTGDVVVNNGVSFDDIRSFIQDQNISDIDKQKLEMLADVVETTIENDIPMKKGFLHKFGDLFSKYGEICSKIVANILPYFLNQ